MKRILAIETSCDETAISIIEIGDIDNETRVSILAHEISSQIDMHKEWGGVVPNIAKREHAKALVPMLLSTLKKADSLNGDSEKPMAGILENSSHLNYLKKLLEREPELYKNFIDKIGSIEKPEIDAVVVTSGPGLEPALWVGINFARALSYTWNIPLVPANHMEGHILSGLLTKTDSENFLIKKPDFPALALLISGGHTEIVKADSLGSYELVGKTRDDAIGEAFDKVARILGLPYPGGPEISKLSQVAEQRRLKQTNADSDLLYEDLTYKIRGVIFKVKKELGLGQKESIYQNAIAIELEKNKISFEKEKQIDVLYDDKKVGVYKPDFLIEDKIILELKSIPFLGKIEKTQALHYLKGSPYELALLVNFGGSDIEILRYANSLRESAGSPRESAFKLPRPMINSDDFDFSFSGLKTAVLYKVKEIGELTENAKIEIAYQFEIAVTEVIIKKVEKAINEFGAKSLIVGGGVIANKRIRHALSVIEGIELFLPEQKFTTDNATMIALAGFFKFQNGEILQPNTPEFENLKANGNLAVHG